MKHSCNSSRIFNRYNSVTLNAVYRTRCVQCDMCQNWWKIFIEPNLTSCMIFPVVQSFITHLKYNKKSQGSNQRESAQITNTIFINQPMDQPGTNYTTFEQIVQTEKQIVSTYFVKVSPLNTLLSEYCSYLKLWLKFKQSSSSKIKIANLRKNQNNTMNYLTNR